MSRVLRELAPGESALAWAVMHALRPRLPDAGSFARLVDEVQRPQGYRLVAALAPGEEEAAAVAGFRRTHHLAWGDTLYVDDLATRRGARRQGHAGALLDWLLAEARRLGCEELHLDSGVGPERADAHRLYLNKGLRIASHHLAIRL